MQNAMVMFTFSILDRKHPFWANSIPKFKVISLKRKMVVYTFAVLDWKHPFWVNLVQKIKIVSLS